MIGPVLLVAAGGLIGGLAEGWPGAAGGAAVGALITFGVAAAAAWWAAQVGRTLEPVVAWQVAPRPPLFGPLCEAVYRRALGPEPAPGPPAEGQGRGADGTPSGGGLPEDP